jgi:hypothetical protein
MESIDWLGEMKKRHVERSIDTSDLDQRLLCYEVRLALENMAYSAFKERWDQVEANAARMLSRLERGLPGSAIP